LNEGHETTDHSDEIAGIDAGKFFFLFLSFFLYLIYFFFITSGPGKLNEGHETTRATSATRNTVTGSMEFGKLFISFFLSL
jgi:hypothetical protein